MLHAYTFSYKVTLTNSLIESYCDRTVERLFQLPFYQSWVFGPLFSTIISPPFPHGVAKSFRRSRKRVSSRRPSHLSPSYHKRKHEPAMPARAIQKSKSHQGPLVPNLLPCRIHRDGSVDASGRYWKPISKGELAFSLFSFFLFLSFFSFFGLFLGGERGGVAVGKGEG